MYTSLTSAIEEIAITLTFHERGATIESMG